MNENNIFCFFILNLNVIYQYSVNRTVRQRNEKYFLPGFIYIVLPAAYAQDPRIRQYRFLITNLL